MKAYVNDLLFKEETFTLVGICMKIHAELGKGFKEVIYQELEMELRKNNIPFVREKRLLVEYGGKILPHYFIADFFVYNSIVLEIKATYSMPSYAFRQALNYLKASRIPLALLINFGEQKLKWRRVVCTT